MRGDSFRTAARDAGGRDSALIVAMLLSGNVSRRRMCVELLSHDVSTLSLNSSRRALLLAVM
jgi:hypothetical protein